MAPDENRDEIEQLIRQSCQTPPPDDEFVRTLAVRARNELLSTLPQGAKAGLPRRREKSAARPWWRAAVAVAGLAAAILVGVLLWNRQEGVAWAHVVEAVRAMPWIHTKAVFGEGQSEETWISFSQNICATRDGHMVHYDDLRSEIRYEYDVPKKKLYRLSVHSRAAEELESAESLFQAIFRGDALRERDLFGSRIVKQRQRTVTEQGRRWILYELELERQGGGPEPPVVIPPISMVIRVNPEKMLPASATVTQGKFEVTPPGSKSVTREAVKVEIAFDYPAEGLADIYALGVPRDTPIEDRMPPPELERIIKIVQQNRRDFGNYLAIAGESNGPKSSIVHLIRCKDDKFRVDDGIGYARHVASGDEMEQWWREFGKEILFEGVALGDGRRVYEHDYVKPEPWWKPSRYPMSRGEGRAAAADVRVSAGVSSAAEYFVELLAYPPRLDPQQIALSPLWTTHFDPTGENGPAGSVRVELQLARRDGPVDQFHVDDRRSYHKEEFWLQPKYDYAVVKHVTSDCPAVDEDPLRKEKGIIYEYDGFRQTPGGLWYPTVSRHKNVSSSENKNKPGEMELHDQVTYFYLDFAAELPDELFTAVWQGDLLAGINFAQRGGEPPSNDLGMIRPPGGVPLWGRGQEILVQGVEKARQRLEAAPPADLEKWVAELERIIDTKLKDGLPSVRQVCRTDFVIHMSVAFDGVKWNAKRADNLFQRAQALPASEAKVWKEAFEALLKKEIGQTDTTNYAGGPSWGVPLVLIPMDALYEGQKYSAERAKKYLALKQLTADDVALWLDKVDQWGGTRLDAAMNIILLDDYFDKEEFQRDKLKAAIGAKKK